MPQGVAVRVRVRACQVGDGPWWSAVTCHSSSVVEHSIRNRAVKGSIPFCGSGLCGRVLWCCGSNSVGRVSASQAEGRGFESRLPLVASANRTVRTPLREFRSGVFVIKPCHRVSLRRRTSSFATACRKGARNTAMRQSEIRLCPAHRVAVPQPPTEYRFCCRPRQPSLTVVTNREGVRRVVRITGICPRAANAVRTDEAVAI